MAPNPLAPPAHVVPLAAAIGPRPTSSTRGLIRAAGGSTEVLLYGAIGPRGTRAETVVRELERLRGPVLLRVHSPGGDVFDGFAIYNAIRKHPARVEARIEGLAASAAVLVALAAARVTIAAAAFLVLEEPSTAVVGSAPEMRETAARLDQVRERMVDIYRGKAGGTRSEIADLLAAGIWFSAAEAVAAGFVDAVDGVETSRAAGQLATLAARRVRLAEDRLRVDRQRIAAAARLSGRGRTVRNRVQPRSPGAPRARRPR